MECHMRALPIPSANDGPRFHTNMPVSELIERDTPTVEASVISSAPLVVEIEDEVTRKTRMTPIRPQGAWGLEPPDPNSGIQLTRVQRLAYEGLMAASRRIEPGEKNQDET